MCYTDESKNLSCFRNKIHCSKTFSLIDLRSVIHYSRTSWTGSECEISASFFKEGPIQMGSRMENKEKYLAVEWV